MTTGASRKNERYDHEEGVTASIEGKAEKQKMESDPMFKLEHTVEDKEKSNDETPRIQLLQVRERGREREREREGGREGGRERGREREREREVIILIVFKAMQEDKKDDFSINQILRKRFRVSNGWNT